MDLDEIRTAIAGLPLPDGHVLDVERVVCTDLFGRPLHEATLLRAARPDCPHPLHPDPKPAHILTSTVHDQQADLMAAEDWTTEAEHLLELLTSAVARIHRALAARWN